MAEAKLLAKRRRKHFSKPFALSNHPPHPEPLIPIRFFFGPPVPSAYNFLMNVNSYVYIANLKKKMTGTCGGPLPRGAIRWQILNKHRSKEAYDDPGMSW